MEILEKFIQEIKRLERGLQILTTIYTELGLYGEDKITKETYQKLREFFGYDDSE